MTKKEKIVWRLGKLPTPAELQELVKTEILTKEEAREILFSTESDDRDEKSLKSEIKFLRELVEKLSNDRSRTIEIIREVRQPYYQYHWFQPYNGWCSGAYYTSGTNGTVSTGATSVNNLTNGLTALIGNQTVGSSGNTAFTSIQTF